ncbi:GH21624 [Drosophila grimshawi]|uniref:GH21624 n=2 Tax=Drosophila grimshawi TaxID=7222 RepID=B4J5C3_DROGR|nr:GH21624 [Drosophila grimshawi]
MRLLEMQRKLSAIAEIPKILSSTLATVSQSFGSEEMLYMQRKCSYDEDALDYELMEQLDSADEIDTEQEDDLVQVQDDDEDKSLLECESKQLKDLTPESDYASEVNYMTIKLSDEPDNDSGKDGGADDEEEQDEDDLPAHQSVYYIKLPAVSADQVGALNISFSDDENENVEHEIENENENDSDFLSTTYTWNLRNVPKLSVSDAVGVCDLTLSPQLEAPSHNADDTSKVRLATLEAATTATSATESQKLLFKLDNLERSWPWADREKIIYKQSTCHLVQRKPLGIVGQRIQLLAKQELLRQDKTP